MEGVICRVLFGKSTTVAGWLQVGGLQLRQRGECWGVSAAASGVAPLTSLAARRNGRGSEGGRGGGKGKGVHARAIQDFWTSCSSVSKHCFTVAGLRIYL